MKKTLALLLCLFSGVAVAQAPAFSGQAFTTSSNKLDRPTYQSYGNINLFVSTLGSDTNSCNTAGAGACRTYEGAKARLPGKIRHPVSVQGECGAYTGTDFSGFIFAPLSPLDGGFIVFNGALADAGLATGLADGTATSGTAGTTFTFGTLADTTQTWTVNALKGMFIETLTGTGSGQLKNIASNTATVITIEGTWTAPGAGTTYAIRDACVVMNAGIINPASPSIAASTTNLVNISANTMNFSPSPAIEFRRMKFDSTATTLGVRVMSNQGAKFQFTQFVATAGSGTLINVFNASSFVMLDSSARQLGTGSPLNLAMNSVAVLSGGGASVQNSLFESNATGASNVILRGGGIAFTSNQVNHLNAAATAVTGSIATAGFAASQSLTNNNVTCTSTSANGLYLADLSSTAAQSALSVTSNSITGCGTAALVQGQIKLFFAGTSTVTGTTTGINAQLGGRVQLVSGTTVSGGTQDFLLDATAYSTADLAAATFSGGGTLLGTVGAGTFITRQ